MDKLLAKLQQWALSQSQNAPADQDQWKYCSTGSELEKLIHPDVQPNPPMSLSQKNQLKQQLQQVVEHNKALEETIADIHQCYAKLRSTELQPRTAKTRYEGKLLANSLHALQAKALILSDRCKDVLAGCSALEGGASLFRQALSHYEARHLDGCQTNKLFRNPKRSTTLGLMSHIRREEARLSGHLDKLAAIGKTAGRSGKLVEHVLRDTQAELDTVQQDSLQYKQSNVRLTSEGKQQLNELIDDLSIPRSRLGKLFNTQYRKALAHILLILNTNPGLLREGGLGGEQLKKIWGTLIQAFPDCRSEGKLERHLADAQSSGQPLHPAVLVFLHCPDLRACGLAPMPESSANSDTKKSMAEQAFKDFGLLALTPDQRKVHQFFNDHMGLVKWLPRRITGTDNIAIHSQHLHFPSDLNPTFQRHTLSHVRPGISGFQGVFSAFFSKVSPEVDVLHAKKYSGQPAQIIGQSIPYSQVLTVGKVPRTSLKGRLYTERDRAIIEQRQQVFQRSAQELDDLVRFYEQPENQQRLNNLAKGFTHFLVSDVVKPSRRPKKAVSDLLKNTDLLTRGQSGGLVIKGPEFKWDGLKDRLAEQLGLEGTDASLVQAMTEAYKLTQARDFVDCTPSQLTPVSYSPNTPWVGTYEHLLTDTANATILVDSVNQLFALKETIKYQPELFDRPVLYEGRADHRYFAGVSDHSCHDYQDHLIRMGFHAYHMQVRLAAIQKSLTNPAVNRSVAGLSTDNGQGFPEGKPFELFKRMRERV